MSQRKSRVLAGNAALTRSKQLTGRSDAHGSTTVNAVSAIGGREP